MALLEIKNIRKSFGHVEVLKGIDFTMEKGDVVAIIGSSGSGKTTLLRCINFLETPDHGKIILKGEELYDADKKDQYSERDIREKRLNFGMVFQNFNLFPQYSALRNLTLAPELRLKNEHKGKDKKVALKQIREEAMSLLKTVGLEEKAANYPCQLSGGQQQRVAIARALAMKPEVLCFDEPTSALDPELTVEVLKVIKDLKNQGRTMIVVTHEMKFARNVADKIIYMADGVIEEMGTPQQLFENPQSEKTKSFLLNEKD